MEFNEFLWLIVIVVVVIFIVQWVESRQSNDLDFNLNDPEDMTPEQRREELALLLNRANNLCKYDNVSGQYIRIDPDKYQRLVDLDRSKSDE